MEKTQKIGLIGIVKTPRNREWKITFSYIPPQNSVQNLEKAYFTLCGLDRTTPRLTAKYVQSALHVLSVPVNGFMFTSELESESESGLLLIRFSHTKK